MMIQEWVSLEFAQLEPQRYLVKEVSIHLRKHASLIAFNFFFFFIKIRVRILRVGIQQLEYESHEISFVEQFWQFFLVIPLSQRFISHEIKYSKVCNKSFSFFLFYRYLFYRSSYQKKKNRLEEYWRISNLFHLQKKPVNLSSSQVFFSQYSRWSIKNSIAEGLASF